jgi:hypothetical protein
MLHVVLQARGAMRVNRTTVLLRTSHTQQTFNERNHINNYLRHKLNEVIKTHATSTQTNKTSGWIFFQTAEIQLLNGLQL